MMVDQDTIDGYLRMLLGDAVVGRERVDRHERLDGDAREVDEHVPVNRAPPSWPACSSAVDTGPDGDPEGGRLHRGDRLSEHPGAFEMTKVYAACSDGRRWNIDHVVSGPRAGTMEGMTARVGPYGPDERGRRPQLIRYAVGLRP